MYQNIFNCEPWRNEWSTEGLQNSASNAEKQTLWILSSTLLNFEKLPTVKFQLIYRLKNHRNTCYWEYIHLEYITYSKTQKSI